MNESKKPTVSEARARNERARKAWEQDKERTHYSAALDISGNLFDDIPYLLDLVDRMGKALGWALQEVEDSTEMDESYTMPLHDCEYATNPEAGKCDFHEGYEKARALLEEIKL